MECEKEKSTQHYLGALHGFGPVKHDEKIAVAVFNGFDSTTNRLAPEFFNRNDLKRYEFSVARLRFVDSSSFRKRVVEPGETNQQSALVGVAVAPAKNIFALMFTCTETIPHTVGRSVCLLDKVTKLDYDGHAAIGYSETQSVLTEKQKKKVRERIHRDLADVFGEIMPIKSIRFSRILFLRLFRRSCERWLKRHMMRLKGG